MRCLGELNQPSTGSMDELRGALRTYLNKSDIPIDYIELIKSYSEMYKKEDKLQVPCTTPGTTFPARAENSVENLNEMNISKPKVTPTMNINPLTYDTVRKLGIR